MLSVSNGEGAAVGEGVASVDDMRGQLQLGVDDGPGGIDTGGDGGGTDNDGQLSGQGDLGSVHNHALGLVAALDGSPVGQGTSGIAWWMEGRNEGGEGVSG